MRRLRDWARSGRSHHLTRVGENEQRLVREERSQQSSDVCMQPVIDQGLEDESCFEPAVEQLAPPELSSPMQELTPAATSEMAILEATCRKSKLLCA